MTHENDGTAHHIRADPAPVDISARTLRMIEEAAENFRRGVVGPPVDPERLKRLAS
jgi:hypothetical protein